MSAAPAHVHHPHPFAEQQPAGLGSTPLQPAVDLSPEPVSVVRSVDDRSAIEPIIDANLYFRGVHADIEEAAVRSRHVAIAEADVVVLGLGGPIARESEFGAVTDCPTSPAIAGREAFDAAPAGFVHYWLGMVPFSGPRLQVAEICSLVQAPPPRREAARAASAVADATIWSLYFSYTEGRADALQAAPLG
jgi:hypothetical protein